MSLTLVALLLVRMAWQLPAVGLLLGGPVVESALHPV
jgi:hypothetical protein